MIGIYKITNPNERVYIGQSINVERRIKYYENYLCNKRQIRLYNSFLKYGIKNHIFEIIEKCLFENLNEKERYWQDYYNVLSKQGLNCRLTFTNDKSGKLSEETKLKLSLIKKGKPVSESCMEGLREFKKNNPDYKFNDFRGKAKFKKLVINTENGIFYDCAKDAAETYNINYSTLTAKLNGRKRNNTNLIYV